ncbi:uncharacterized protein LOC120413032 [Culex pipiens pallens]|uniref:uncharacterized protein LOC120413032 n=1 Tax=Culex pipiens pallens TaxID=42434 RepID=UPI00195425A7|nr:uncharacterized protein LOC120413032 [Culex pipiens pallens]
MELFRKARLAKSRLDKWFLELVECSQDPFWLLDRYLILAGTHFTPRNRWQRIGWLLYQFVTYSNLTIALMCFISAVIFEEDSVTVIRTFLIFVTMSLSLYKQHWLLQNRVGIGRLRNLLETHEFCSGDPDFDESVRKRFKRTSRTLIITISWIITLQQILSWIPSDTQDIIFEIPSWIAWCWGERVSLVIQVWYISICVTIWCSKLYGCTVTAVTLMVGYEAEQRILTHRFEHIQNDLHDLRQNYWDSELARKQYWERLRTLVRVFFNQQQLLLRYVKFEAISRHMFYLCARLPYSEDRQKDYLDMRATLQIIAMCSRNAVTFGCAGVSEISIAVFTEMLNTCYSVFTFLRKMV